MARKFNYGKIAVAVFITVLIWVWADLAQDEVLPERPATIVVDESANPKLWVSFDGDSSADIKITLSGPHSAIANISRELKEGKRLEFDFDAAQEKMDEPDSYPLTLLPFLQKDKKIKRFGLKVKSCEPDTLSVNVVGLVKKSLTVKCVGEDQNPIKDATIEPAQVDMFVPADWEGEKLTAFARLTRREIIQARLSPIKKTPYIKLTVSQTKEAPATVKITTPPEPDLLSGYTITATTLSIALSPTLQGKYSVEVTNLNEVLSPIAIRATPDAKRAYQMQPYPSMTLYILDDDAKKETKEQRRHVVYNFPPEFLRKGEIELKNPQQPAEARFKLIPLPSAEAS